MVYIGASDEESTTLYISPQVEQLLGFSSCDWKADRQLWTRQLHPEDREHVLDQAAARESGGRYVSEYRLFTRDGRTLWISDVAMPVKDGDGRVSFLQGVVIDLTARKEGIASQRCPRLATLSL